MPESIVREELDALGIRVQAVLQLRFGRRDQDVAKDRPSTPQFVVQWPEAQTFRRCVPYLNCAA